MTNGLTIKKTESENRIPIVCVGYHACFDWRTGEYDSFTAEFALDKYKKGMKELARKGSCSISGQYGSVSIRGKDLLHMTMQSGNESISIPVSLEELSLQ
jgi:hypothetical protein